MLDSLTRFELQDTLLRVWEESGKTVVMVTHDVDDVLYLAAPRGSRANIGLSSEAGSAAEYNAFQT